MDIFRQLLAPSAAAAHRPGEREPSAPSLAPSDARGGGGEGQGEGRLPGRRGVWEGGEGAAEGQQTGETEQHGVFHKAKDLGRWRA